jgi:predicted RNA binding protein YcfA (HicA-like mRNA interferase family)
VNEIPSSREIIDKIRTDGWILIKVVGDHHHFKHPNKPGKVTGAPPGEGRSPKNLQEHHEAGGALASP